MDALVRQMAGMLLLLYLEIASGLLLLKLGEAHGNVVGLGVAADVRKGRPRDDKRCPSFIDEDVIDLVDDGEVETFLALMIEGVKVRIAPAGGLHVVAEVIKAVLAV